MPQKKQYKNSTERSKAFRARKKELENTTKIAVTKTISKGYYYPCKYCKRVCLCNNYSPERLAVCDECSKKYHRDKDGILRLGTEKDRERMKKHTQEFLGYVSQYR